MFFWNRDAVGERGVLWNGDRGTMGSGGHERARSIPFRVWGQAGFHAWVTGEVP
jgi:hypothetical protein